MTDDLAATLERIARHAAPSPRRPIDLLGIRDAQVHRCTCGSWVLGDRPCGTCTIAAAAVAA